MACVNTGGRRAWRRSRLLLAATFVSAGIGLASCERAVDRPRVLLVGIDGATFRVIGPMMAEERLPNLSRIAAVGVSGPLHSLLPLHSPRIWNTIATGKVPAKHGILSFVHADEHGNHLYLSSDRRVPALWNIVSSHGRTVGVVNWWNSYPPEHINGVMVSDHFFPEQLANLEQTFKAGRETAGPRVFPQEWEPKAQAAMSTESPLVPMTDPFKDNADLPPWIRRDGLSRQFHTDHQVTRVALALDADIHPDLLMVYLPGVDRVSHSLWGNLEPAELYPERLRPSPPQRQAGVNALQRYYEYVDALVGKLVERFDDDDVVMVVSDHGFEAGTRLMLLTGQHETPNAAEGIIFARGRGVHRPGSAAPVTVSDITPTVLAALGLASGGDMDGKQAAFLKASTPPAIASYDGMRIERLSAEPSGVEGQIVDQLRELGYVE
jgi:predicted AlkP superfamily phosphohydrolase/phosphomutase